MEDLDNIEEHIISLHSKNNKIISLMDFDLAIEFIKSVREFKKSSYNKKYLGIVKDKTITSKDNVTVNYLIEDTNSKVISIIVNYIRKNLFTYKEWKEFHNSPIRIGNTSDDINLLKNVKLVESIYADVNRVISYIRNELMLKPNSLSAIRETIEDIILTLHGDLSKHKLNSDIIDILIEDEIRKQHDSLYIKTVMNILFFYLSDLMKYKSIILNKLSK